MILVDNRAGQEYNEQVVRFEDLIGAQVGSDVLSVISREDVVRAQRIYDAERPTASTAATAPNVNVDALTRMRQAVFSATAVPAERISGTATTTEDWKTLRNSTALNLARMIGADLILAATLDSVSTEITAYTGNGIKMKRRIVTLRGTYKLLDLNQGNTLISAPLKTVRSFRETEGLKVEVSDVCAELMEKAAETVAKDVRAKAEQIRTLPTDERMDVLIACTSRDLQGNDVTFPDLRVTEDGKVLTTETPLTVQITATVELDGVLVGTSPCTIKVRPGLHKIRILAPGFADYAGNANVAPGMKELNVTLQMTDAGFARWQDVRQFLQNLSADKKILEAALQKDRTLTDAQVDYIKGQAEMYRNSHFRISKLPSTLVTGMRGWSLFDVLNF